jgi:serine/threonine-protein kinase
VNDPLRAESALHGERLVATVRLALFAFRAVVMITFSLVSASVEPMGMVRRLALVIYAIHCVAPVIAMRRSHAGPKVAKLALLPHIMNVIDYGFVIAMALSSNGQHDPTNLPEVAAMNIVIILLFSVAREGTLQAVVSTVLACATYLFLATRLPDHKSVVTAFVIGSYLACATLALRVALGLRRRVDLAMRLGQYTLVRKLGEGGMGVVYEATHAMLRRPTAVKLLSAAKPNDTSLVRFEREVQLTSRLTHPNTIAIFDYGKTPDGIFYYAMELLDGANLEDLVRAHGRLEPARVVHVLRQVCGSLAEAHAAGLIHRDIKPANIVLCERGGVADVAKVLDFGLVKSVGAGAAFDVATTASSQITGTPLFMAPEAIVSPDNVDARSDLYAVGCVGYFLLTGEHVFKASTLVEVCSHHLHTKPKPPSERCSAEIPADLEQIILACLEKDPDARPADADALSARLASVALASPWTAADARAWWRSREDSIEKLAGAATVTGSLDRSLVVDLAVRNE